MSKIKIFVIIKEDSVRVSRKNFKVLGNKPLWKHLLYELYPYDVYVDTDSKEILEECSLDTNLSHVISYPRKQKFIDLENNDKENLSPVISLIDNFLDEHVDSDDDTIITTHVTSPFLTMRTILDGAKKLDEGYDSIVSVSKTLTHSWLYEDGNVSPINFNPKVVQKTQDLNPIYMSNGAFFIFKKNTFKKLNNRIGEKPYYYELPSPEDIEIDTYDDLNLAKLIYEGLR